MASEEELKVVRSQGWLVVVRPSCLTFRSVGVPAGDLAPYSESQPRPFFRVVWASAP